MLLKIDSITITKKELEEMDRTDPYKVVGAFIQTISDYQAKDFTDKIQDLVGEIQPITEVMKQNIKDRMLQNEKYKFIGKSYFKGATPENDYTPVTPYSIEIKENEGIKKEEGFKYLLVQSGGADNPRGITLRLAKDGNYYVWSDSFMGLLSDIRQPESTNPWA